MTKEMNCYSAQTEGLRSDRVPTTAERLRSWTLSPQGLTVTGIAVAVVGLSLGWSWVVALGVAPLILALGPCLVMCTLGLCMHMRDHADTPSVKPSSRSDAGPQSATSSVPQSPGN